MSGNGSRFWGTVLTLGITGMTLLFLFALMDSSRSIDNPMPAFVTVAAGAVLFGLVRGPIGRSIARMLEGPPVADEQLVARVEQLEDRQSDQAMDQLRVAELEERLDFAERLLAQRQPALQVMKPED
jgi:hypothetical protein